jgi:hypothetical protein
MNADARRSAFWMFARPSQGDHANEPGELFRPHPGRWMLCSNIHADAERRARTGDPRVAKSMETLKAMTAKLGAPELEGKEAVGGKDAPALYFGTTKINNTVDIVDAVGKEDGKGMTATLFVKGGDEYIRVSTSVLKPDGSGRAIGTVLAGPALESIKAGKSYYGEVPILGTPYITGYEPIKDSSGDEIGIYYVGYKK